MAEKKHTELRTYAELGFLEYIDGYSSQIIGMKPKTDQDGNDVWEFVLNPSDKLIIRYQLKPNSKGNMLYSVQLPQEYVILLNPDPSNTRYLYLLTYDNEETSATKKLKGFSQQKEIRELKDLLSKETLKREADKEKLQLMETNLPSYIQRNVTPIIEQLTPLLEKLNKGKKDE